MSTGAFVPSDPPSNQALFVAIMLDSWCGGFKAWTERLLMLPKDLPEPRQTSQLVAGLSGWYVRPEKISDQFLLLGLPGSRHKSQLVPYLVGCYVRPEKGS